MSVGIQAQVDSAKIKIPKDTVARLFDRKIIPTKVVTAIDSANKKAFKPDPIKVVWMAAILPGYGQILNRKYWKLPIVYGGFLGCAYSITWNSSMYNSYKNAYLDINQYNTDPAYRSIVDKNPSVVSFYQILPKGRTIDDFGGIAAYTVRLNSAQESYRRYRDLSVILTIGYYALTIVDAYVDAQLYDFDISPNLSMHIQPTLLNNGSRTSNTFAMQCCISLK
jgi:hypothetical protein